MRVSEERMREIAAYLCGLILQSDAEKYPLLGAWTQNLNDVENKPIAYVSNIIKGWVDIPQPFAQPRENALADFVIPSITTQSPMVTCVDAGSAKRQDNRERTMDFMLRRAQFGERLKTIARSAWCTNHGIMRMSYGGPESPLKLESIKADDFVIVGSGAYNIRESRMVGHRYCLARAELEAGQRSGRYAKEVDMDALPPMPGSRNEGSVSHAASPSDDLIELYQVYPVMDPKQWAEDGPEVSGKERRFSVVLEMSTQSILRIEEYEYKALCYFSFGYQPAPEQGFWSQGSVGSDMQGPHRAYNALGNMALAGTAMSAFPPLVATGGAFAPDQRYGPAEFVNQDAGSLTIPATNFDLVKVQAELARIERLGDAVARVNQAGIAQESSQAKTATQSDNEAAGMRAGITGYLETFTSDIPELCEHAEEILADTFNEWKPIYKESAPVMSPDEFMSPVRWDIPGKVPNLQPQAVIANAQTVSAMVVQAFQLAAQMPALMPFMMDIMQVVLNAMDFPNADEIMRVMEQGVAPPQVEDNGYQDQGSTGMVAPFDPGALLGQLQGGMGDQAGGIEPEAAML